MSSLSTPPKELATLVDLLSRATDITQSAAVAAELKSDGPTTAGAGGGGDISDIYNSLVAAVKGPSAEVESGSAPMPQNVVIGPEDKPMTDAEEKRALIAQARQDMRHLQDINSIADLFIALSNASKRAARGHPQRYRITDPKEAAQEFADMANSAYNVMIGPLAGMFSFTSGTSTRYQRSMSKSELHLSFLSELFSGFNLTDVAMNQLDGILKNFIKSLGTVSVETEDTNNTVDQTIRVHQTIAVNISGSKENPIWDYQPRSRIVYMKIDAKAWRWATNKANHESNTFDMHYVVVDCDLNVRKWLASKPALEKVFMTISQKSLAEYSAMRNPPAIDAAAK
jgi:hypothetical protein